jgi:hypothetical protein
MSIEQLLYKLNLDIIDIGKKLLQNKKLDYQNSIDYLRFYKLITYKKILIKYQIPNTIDFAYYSFNSNRILDTIKNIVLSHE